MNRLKHIALNLLLVCFGIAAALGILELGVRIIGLYNPPSADFVEPHPELGWSHVPDKTGYWQVGEKRIPIRINSKGLRDNEYSYQKQDGVFRILVLGDSFTEAFQVLLNDTFCKVLERRLNETDRKFEIINAGLGGVGTDYALLFLKREGFKYDPDLLLVAFFPNDIIENYKSRRVLDDTRAQSSLYYGKKDLMTTIKQFLADHSHAFNYFGAVVINRLPWVKDLLVEIGLIGAVPVEGGHRGIHLHYLVLQSEYSSELKRAWSVTEVLFRRLAEKARSQNSKLAVVSIPFREQVYESLWEAELRRPEMQRRHWDLDKPGEMLSAVLNKMDVPVLRLLPEFKSRSSNQALYYGINGQIADGHWTAAGHHLAAELIYQWLIAENLVPVNSKQ